MTDAVRRPSPAASSKRYGGVTALAARTSTLRAGRDARAASVRTAPASRRWSRSCAASTAPDAGSVRVDGDDGRVSATPGEAAAAGIAFVAQELSLFPDLTVRENLFPLDARAAVRAGRPGAMDRRPRPRARASSGLRRRAAHPGRRARPGRPAAAGDRPGAARRTRACSILDEPTSALPRAGGRRGSKRWCAASPARAGRPLHLPLPRGGDARSPTG